MIRLANTKDIDSIYKLCETYNPKFRTLFLLDTELKNDFSILLLEEENNAIISFLLAQDFKDYIDLLFIIVNDKYKSKGYGTKLLQYFVDNYKDNNKSVLLEVAENNICAKRLYEKIGFKKVGIRKGYYNGVDAIIMRCD